MVHDLWRFVKALFHHWVPLLTCGGIMAALGVIEHRIGTSVSWPYYSATVTFFFLYSCFLAWRDECRGRVELEERARPKLSTLQWHGKKTRSPRSWTVAKRGNLSNARFGFLFGMTARPP